MKSAYCAAIFLCSAMLWLQEKKKACGIDQNRYLKTAVGYGLTRFLLPVIAQQSMKGSVTVLAMDLVICRLVFYLSKRDSEQSYAAESLFFYVWNPVPAMAALSQEKNRMVVIWLSVLIFVWMVRCTETSLLAWHTAIGCGHFPEFCGSGGGISRVRVSVSILPETERIRCCFC